MSCFFTQQTASRHKLLEDTRADVMILVNAQRTSYFEVKPDTKNPLKTVLSNFATPLFLGLGYFFYLVKIT